MNTQNGTSPSQRRISTGRNKGEGGNYAEAVWAEMVAEGTELKRHVKGNTASQWTMGDKVMAESRSTGEVTEIASAGSRKANGMKEGRNSSGTRRHREGGRGARRVGNSGGSAASSSATLVTDSNTGAVSRGESSRQLGRQRLQSANSHLSVSDISVQQDGNKYYNWTQVINRKNDISITNLRELITGTMKNDLFKGARRTLDVFLGRVDTEVTCDGIKEHIRDIFSIAVIYVKQLVIRSNELNAFEITVNAGDRDKLLNGEMWPEQVDRFHGKTKNFNSD